METTANKLSRWLRSQILREQKTGKVIRLELRHLPSGAKQGQEVSTLDMRSERADDNWFTSQASLFIDEAQNDCDGLAHGTQRYVILAYREEQPERARARFPFVLSYEEESVDGYESEPPTKSGLTQQLMRHLEAKERTFMASLGTVLHTMQRMASTLSDENHHLREHQISTMTMVEELLSMRHERELEAHKAEARINIMKDTAKDIKLLLPAIVQRLTGQKSESSSDNPEQISRFLNSLDDEQKAQIASILKPAQQIALMEFINSDNGPN